MLKKQLGTSKNPDSGAMRLADALIFNARQRIELTPLLKPHLLALYPKF